jgi:hypothetical protein
MRPVSQMLRCYIEPDNLPANAKKSRKAKTTPDYILQQMELAKVEDRVGPDWKPWGGPSLVIDVETTTDIKQIARFGIYQLRGHDFFDLMELAKQYNKAIPRNVLDELNEEGLFYNEAEGLCSEAEIETMQAYAKAHSLKFMTMADFIGNVFYKIYSVKAKKWTTKSRINPKTGITHSFIQPDDALPCMIIGHNLPFDLGAMAYDAAPSRKGNYGGLTLKLRENYPHVTIKKIGFAKHMFGTHAKFGRVNHMFINTQQLARALFGASVKSSLDGVAKALGLKDAKGSADYEGSITPEYIGYCRRDVSLTWQVFTGLRGLYLKHGFNALNNKGVLSRPIDKIYSEASVGKGYFEQLGMRSFREQNPDFDHKNVTSAFMAAMYGGRSEVRWRLDLRRGMQGDFKSQYPTANALMRLQDLNIAKKIKVVCDETGLGAGAQFLRYVCLADMRLKETWPKLRGVALIDPAGCILPVRTVYHADDDAKAQQIGVNEVASGMPCWYTFADVIASKLLTGRTPNILKTITLEPVGVQNGLKPHSFFGDPEYTIDLTKNDLFQRLIDMRTVVKREKKDGWKPKEQGIKLTANGTSYGVLIEFVIEEKDKEEDVTVYTPGREYPRTARKVVKAEDGEDSMSGFKVERPGRWFAPWGPLIPAAGRLLLAIAEKLAADRGISHGFCDTDSMFFILPDGMKEQDFINNVKDITGWFQALNPYEGDDAVFALEDVNYRLIRDASGNIVRNKDGEAMLEDKGAGIKKEVDLPWLIAISAKRYAIANKAPDGSWLIRKASGHGLGHISAPQYKGDRLPAHAAAPFKDGMWSEGALCKGTNPKLFLDLWRIVFTLAAKHKAKPRIGEDLEQRIDGFLERYSPRMKGLEAEQMVQQSIASRAEWLAQKSMPWKRAFGFYNSVPSPMANVFVDYQCSAIELSNRKDLLSTSFYTKGGKKTRILSGAEYEAKGKGAEELYRRDNSQFPAEMFNPDYGLRFQTVAEALSGYFTHPEFKSEGKYGLLRRRKLVILNHEIVGKESHDILYNGDDPELDDEDLLNRRIMITSYNSNLLKGFGVEALAKALGVTDDTVRHYLLYGFPLKDDVLARLKRMIEVDETGGAKLVKMKQTPAETKRNLKMARRLLIIRRSLSEKSKLAPIEEVISTVVKRITPEALGLIKYKYLATLKSLTNVLTVAIPNLLIGGEHPYSKFMPAVEHLINEACGAAAYQKRLADLNDRYSHKERTERSVARRKAKRAAARQSAKAIMPTVETIIDPYLGPQIVAVSEARKIRRREQSRLGMARLKQKKSGDPINSGGHSASG